MHRLKIIHFLRTSVFLLVLMLIVGVVGTLIWANSTGMPKSWRQAIEGAIAQHGVHMEIGGLSYHPLEGIVARDVKVFSGPDRKEVISRLEGLILDFDNSKLAKGEVQISKVKLSKGRLELPADPDDPDSEVLEITDIEGEFTPPGNRYIEIRNARGTIAGIEVVLNAKILDDLRKHGDPTDSTSRRDHHKLIAKIMRELRQWRFDDESPPEIRIQCVGNRSQLDQIKADISFTANAVEKNMHSIESIKVEAEVRGSLLTVHSLQASNGTRRLDARLDYAIDEQHGRFDVKSTLEIPDLLQSWLEIKPLNDLTIAGKQEMQASGEFHIKHGEAPDIRATGHALCQSAMLRGISFDQIESSFAWHNGDLFFKDLILVRPDGEVTGKVLMQGNLVRMDLRSTLLPEYYRPLFLETPIEEIIDQFAVADGSSLELDLEGGFDRTDLRSWAYTGTASIRNMKYKGVALTELDTTLSMSEARMDFTDVSFVFDYTDYAMAKRYNGPKTGSVSVDSVRYHREDNSRITYENLKGSHWPAPLCRMFLTKTADNLEAYGFHSPPSITSSGTIDLEDGENTRVVVDFTSTQPAVYEFLKSPVTLSKPRGRVIVTKQGVEISKLQVGAFDGSVQLDLLVPKNKPMRADLRGQALSMDSINSTYGMNMECGGKLSGQIKFTMIPEQIGTMQGTGNFSLEKAELFSVPIFGPLSHILQLALNDKRVGAERAKEATCSFVVKDGVMASDDFKTSTTSLVFAGEGWVDLDEKTMDMTMRLNARGLLGLITLPFRPLYGLFQFRGTGPLAKPEWQRVAFTKPNDKVQELLLKTPEQR